MKKITLLAFALICFGANSQVISHSNSMDLGTTNVACNNGTAPNTSSSDNRYFRFFNLSTFGLATGYNVSSVQYGIQSVNTPTLLDGFPVTVKLYSTLNTNFPTGFPTGYIELASVTTNHTTADAGTLVSIPVSAVVPAGSNLVVEVGYLAQTAGSLNRIFLSANNLGQTAPSYLLSVTCGIASPTDMAAINFPNAHLVMSVTGTSLGTADRQISGVSVYPNPAKDIVNFDLPSNVELNRVYISDITGKQIHLAVQNNSVDISRFESGVYMMTLETNEGNITKKIAKQ